MRRLGTAAFTGGAGQLRFEQQAPITLIDRDTNGDIIADFAIELTGHKALPAADFVL